MKIHSAIIPAAGYGTRFLPYTKAIPKEMLPLLNAPAIHTIIQEGLQAHIDHFFFITGKEKQAINNYFKQNKSLDQFLKKKNKSHLLSSVDKLIDGASFSYINQPKALGLGHAVLMAKNSISDPFLTIMLPDDIIINKKGALLQLLEIAHEKQASIIAVTEVPHNEVSSYGIIAPKMQLTDDLFEVGNLVEKPQPHQTPSNMAIIGRYVLSQAIFDSLEHITPSHAGEIQLTDGIAHMMQTGQPVYALKIKGERHDIGNPLGWIKAIISLALEHPDYGPEIHELIRIKLLQGNNRLEILGT